MGKKLMYGCVLLVAGMLAFTGCVSTPASGKETVQTVSLEQIETTVSSVDKYGNCLLAAAEDTVLSQGYEAGDIVHITVGTFLYDAPVCTNYSDVDNGAFLVRLNKGTVQLSVNMGNMSKKGSVTSGAPVIISLAEKAGYLREYQIRQLKKSENRSDYASDEIFANFRAVSAGKIAENRLYRSCNPVYTDARAPYAEKLVEQAGIKTVLNLADSQESASGQLPGAPYYASLVQSGNVVFLDMGVAFYDDDFVKKLHDGLVFLSSHSEGPYLVHCNEGKDRAGFVSAVLEAVNGATLDEMTADYMISYENYYGVQKGSEQYRLISRTIPDMFKTLNGGKAVTDRTVGKTAEKYLLDTVGLTNEQLAAVRKNLR